MRKGISPVVSTVTLILISISAIYLALSIIRPTVERVYEQAVINEAEQNLKFLDNMIREVASEGTGSSRSIILKVSDGNYKLINMSGNFTGAFQFKIELKHSPFETLMFKKVGNLKYTAGMNSVGLIGYWKLNERNGTTAEDSSGYENHGKLYNGSYVCSNPPLPGCPEWVEGRFGNALSFDGVDDYVEIPHNPVLSSSSQITITAWLYMKSLGTWSRWIAKGHYGGAREYLIISDTSYNTIKFSVFQGGVEKSTPDYVNPPLNQWIFIVGRYNGSELSFWLNGVKVTSTALTGNMDTTNQNLTFGTELGSYLYVNGTIDEVRIYNRALSEEEIKENFHASPSNYQVVLEYDKIILTGNLRIGKGTHKICVEKIGEFNNKPLIKLMVCD